jgi:hypothetical protein
MSAVDCQDVIVAWMIITTSGELVIPRSHRCRTLTTNAGGYKVTIPVMPALYQEGLFLVGGQGKRLLRGLARNGGPGLSSAAQAARISV